MIARLTTLLRPGSATGWALGVIAIAVVMLAISGLRWDPFGLEARRLKAAEARASVAIRSAQAKTLEAEGERVLATHALAAEALTHRAETATFHLTQSARSADDADLPLAPDRADRLRGHDGELCRLAPHLGGCAPSTGAADPQPDALRPAPAAGSADPG